MGYNKDQNVTPLPLLLYSTNYTTSHARPHCDEQIITGQSRWNPTPEQMMVLQEVYNSGTRTPTTQQIQEIASQLQKYGRIEGKNVFYWFQNHKSRERLKRRRHNQQESFGFNNVHEERLPNKENVVALGNKNSSVLRRRGDHRLIHTVTCLSSSSTHTQNNNIDDDGKMEEYDHGRMEEEKEATCQNQINRINTFYHLNITSKEREASFNEHKYNLNEEEEETRKSRTLDLFPVRDNQVKTDATSLEEKNTKPDHLCCNYYYYYEFMPLMN
ncbi:hypothetical protein AALP_AA1G168800 [Arabis alpina]|uniref:Homeobox domain-containing protein n=1 Tax=Arabis alpina TaxID=50452 RepID=A0A087HNQ4_ARAAL|nr:hypothetical protein AALP_AA1G168800 [Arabis alpina]